MLSRINPAVILAAHFGTFREYPSDRRSWGEIGLHFGLPVTVTVSVFVLRVALTTQGVALLVTSLSVFVGLLFNLLVLATGLRIADPRSTIYHAARQLSREILINVEFAIAVAFAAIVLLLPAAASLPEGVIAPRLLDIAWRAASALCAGLLTSFVLTLLMILKRMHVVLVQHFNARTRPVTDLDPT